MNYLIRTTSYKLCDRKLKELISTDEKKIYSLVDSSFDDVLNDLAYVPLFGEKQTIIIKNLEAIIDAKKDNDDLNKLLTYISDTEDDVILISEKNIPNKTKVGKELNSKLKLIDIPDITKPYELANFMRGEFKTLGMGISEVSLNNFVSKCASNVDIALMEADKLKLIKGDNLLISENDVKDYVSNYNINDVFDFKDAIINKKIDLASSMIDELEASHAVVVPIVVMLAKEYELVYLIKKYASERKNNDQISSLLDGMHPYRVKILREVGNIYSLEQLENIILYLCNLNIKCVSEDNLGYDELRKLLLIL